MVVLIAVVVAFLYYVFTEYFKNSYIDCILFLTLLISHLIWDYYFLPIEILVALSGANLLSRFFKKKRSQQSCWWIIKTKGKIGIFKMKHFFAGIGEIRFSSYLLSLCVGLAPLFHIYVIGSEMSFVKIVLSILGVIFVGILTIARIYRRFFYNSLEQYGLVYQLERLSFVILLLLSFYIEQLAEVKVVYLRKENLKLS